MSLKSYHFNYVFMNVPAELWNVTTVLILFINIFPFVFFLFRLNSRSHISLKLSLAINKLCYSYLWGFGRRSTPPLPSKCHRFRRWVRFLIRVWIFTRFSAHSIEEAPSSLRYPPQFSWSRKEDAVLQPKSQRWHSKYELMMCLATRCCDVFL